LDELQRRLASATQSLARKEEQHAAIAEEHQREEQAAQARLAVIADAVTKADADRKTQLSDAEKDLELVLRKKQAELQAAEETLARARKDIDDLRDKASALNRSHLEEVKKFEEHRATVVLADRDAQAALDKKRGELQAANATVGARRRDLQGLRSDLANIGHSLEQKRAAMSAADAQHQRNEADARQRWSELEEGMRKVQ
jgi:chromosome segregation ATPase